MIAVGAARSLAVAVSLLSAACAGAPGSPFARGLEDLTDAARPAEVAVAWRDLRTGETVLVRGDLEMHAASTMKVAVMIEAFRQHEAGLLDLDEPMALHNEFRSIIDGSPYSLDRADDSDDELHGHIGQRLPLRQLVRRMIVRSSNLATNAVIERVGAQEVQASIEGLGTSRMKVLRGVEDGVAFRAGRNNTTTARDLMVLLAAIADGRAASATACDEMLAILAAQEHNEMIPAGLPPGTRIAHKTGWITGIHHDAAVVFGARGPAYVVVVLTRGFRDRAASSGAGAAIARHCHRRVPD